MGRPHEAAQWPTTSTVGFLKQEIPLNTWRDGNPQVIADLSGASFSGANLSGANLGGANLIKANFRRTNLRGAYLVEARLSGARLAQANLSGANLNGASLTGAHVTDADLSGANLSGAILSKANLRGAILSGTNLSRANLSEANLKGANFNGANLSEAILDRANLRRANLIGASLLRASLTSADLTGANVSEANVSEANLRGAKLILANFREANLNGAKLISASLVDADFTGADLTGCRVYGASVWGLKLDRTKQLNLIITPESAPDVTVDNIEVAQFIYLMLHNQKIRDVIDTITSKAVLILGRFTSDRKAVLDAVREELRKRNYLPILIDFDGPATRDPTETVSLLARLARFIIVDLTHPSSVPKELEAIVPDLAVPVQPLLEGNSQPYSMFGDYWKYDWVLPVYRYEGSGALLATLAEKVIAPAETKVNDLSERRRMIHQELVKLQ